ncbi:hypothetical protein [Acidovorax delafieldii]|uniref:hypothetical protein n=1 Tax=Acidovorax delafieldii TaxID=47920 RepID=UPI000A818349|nr:hypothetical protein [Acidovorax delafieldii]
MDDFRESQSKELKELGHIALNTSLLSDLLEQAYPVIKDRVEIGFADLTSEVKSVRGTLQAILVALVVIAIILLMK